MEMEIHMAFLMEISRFGVFIVRNFGVLLPILCSRYLVNNVSVSFHKVNCLVFYCMQEWVGKGFTYVCVSVCVSLFLDNTF